jgi:hypothetical protein
MDLGSDIDNPLRERGPTCQEFFEADARPELHLRDKVQGEGDNGRRNFNFNDCGTAFREDSRFPPSILRRVSVVKGAGSKCHSETSRPCCRLAQQNPGLGHPSVLLRRDAASFRATTESQARPGKCPLCLPRPSLTETNVMPFMTQRSSQTANPASAPPLGSACS